MKLMDYLKEYRVKHGVSQRQFAEKCGMSNGYISMLERGKNPKTNLPIIPSMTALAHLAYGMGVSLDKLFEEIDDMPISLDSGENDNLPVPTNKDRQTDAVVDEMTSIILALSPEKRLKGLSFLRFLSEEG